jgi:hypothetical protein
MPSAVATSSPSSRSEYAQGLRREPATLEQDKRSKVADSFGLGGRLHGNRDDAGVEVAQPPCDGIENRSRGKTVIDQKHMAVLETGKWAVATEHGDHVVELGLELR